MFTLAYQEMTSQLPGPFTGNELSTLALGISAIKVFKDIPGELVDMRSFWTHSVAVGVLAKHLGKKFPEISGERLFVSGLLHDIGRLVMFRRLPAISTEAIIYAHSNAMAFSEKGSLIAPPLSSTA